MITAAPATVRVDATSLITYRGTPNRTVSWQLTGSGSVTPLSPATDAGGTAMAVFSPSATGSAAIAVTAGA